MEIKKIIGAAAVLAVMISVGAPAFAAEEKPTLAEEVASGLAILQKIQAKELACAAIADPDYELLGEYFMDQMMGDSHEAMNLTLRQRIGESGEEAMHIAMGKRFSGCDISAALPLGGSGFFPMMQMMGGAFTPSGWSDRTASGGWGMMSGWTGISWFWMLIWYLFAVLLIALGVRWLVKVRHAPHKSSLEIIKERYAKGELTKEHFEEMRKELLK